MKTIDRILKKKKYKFGKIVAMFAMTQLHYRKPLGDAAWVELNKLIGLEATQALAMIAGFQMARGMRMTGPKNKSFDRDALKQLL